MGQDGEAAAELVATIRGEHVAMKTWFMGSSPAARALRQLHGDYPGLWKEVLNWKGWKEARKEYLKEQHQGPSSSATTGNSVDAEEGPRKRRSRWGDAVSTDANADDQQANANKRRSRWGSAEQQPPVQEHALPGLGIGAMTPQQQEEMRRLQLRLRDINDKLATVDREAARVDALPRGSRERSPSPAPGTPYMSLLPLHCYHSICVLPVCSRTTNRLSHCRNSLRRGRQAQKHTRRSVEGTSLWRTPRHPGTTHAAQPSH
jgi:hypothetical protein